MTPLSYLIKPLLQQIVSSNQLHAKWLNSLSYLENCGARKIAACEHPTLVKEEMLKHASEEFRHALHLKRQIGKISSASIENYSLSFLLGGISTLHYLRALDVKTSRYLKKAGIPPSNLKQLAYVLVTYAIERRASELYFLYDQILKEMQSKVSIKSILLEEKEHLNEMQEAIQQIAFGTTYAREICSIESSLCETWLYSISSHIANLRTS